MNDPWSRDPLDYINPDDLGDDELAELGISREWEHVSVAGDVYAIETPRRRLTASELPAALDDVLSRADGAPWIAPLGTAGAAHPNALCYMDGDMPHVYGWLPAGVSRVVP